MCADEVDSQPFVVAASDVMPFSLPGDGAVYESRAVIERDGAESKDLLVNHFTVFARKELKNHVHPENDELYYILDGTGIVELGKGTDTDPIVRHFVARDSAVFIPAGVFHRLANESDAPLTLLTVWPRMPAMGSNPIYDGRRASWGTSFRLCGEEHS